MKEVLDGGAREAGISLAALCRHVGMSRQNYYAARRFMRRREIDEGFVVELVKHERQMQPRLGVRKLLHLLRGKLEEANVKIGRDRFFEVLGAHDLLVTRKPGRPRTTNSRHSLPVFHNLLKEAQVSASSEAWVCDLTYIRTDEGFMYAALITDVFSRKIVGSHIGDNLEAAGCIKALEQALAELPDDRHPIHHSDRGCQYCCHAYVDLLQERGLPVSMTEISHCYENAMAERVNGILKQEYELDSSFRSKSQAKKAFEQAVLFYNWRRPHSSLDYQFPAEVHAAA